MARFRKATAREVSEIFKALEQHWIKTGDGRGHYADGYDDERIAKIAGREVSASSVSTIRLSEFGKFDDRQAPRIDRAAEIAALRDKIETLEAVALNLRDVVNATRNAAGLTIVSWPEGF